MDRIYFPIQVNYSMVRECFARSLMILSILRLDFETNIADKNDYIRIENCGSSVLRLILAYELFSM